MYLIAHLKARWWWIWPVVLESSNIDEEFRFELFAQNHATCHFIVQKPHKGSCFISISSRMAGSSFNSCKNVGSFFISSKHVGSCFISSKNIFSFLISKVCAVPVLLGTAGERDLGWWRLLVYHSQCQCGLQLNYFSTRGLWGVCVCVCEVPVVSLGTAGERDREFIEATETCWSVTVGVNVGWVVSVGCW